MQVTHGTALSVRYTDAANYKTGCELHLSGRFTREQWERLKVALDDETGFVPHQIGLLNPAMAFVGHDGFPNDELDHGWAEIPEAEGDYDDLYPSCLLTVERAPRMSVEEFVVACEAQTWNPLEEFERMKESA